MPRQNIPMMEGFHILMIRLKKVFNDGNRKPIIQMVLEMVVFGILKKTDPRQYLNSMLYRKEIKDPYVYLSHREYIKLRRLVTKPERAEVLANKLEFQRFFGRTEIRIPACIGFIEKGRYEDKSGHHIIIKSTQDLSQLLHSLLREERTSFFAKPFDAYGGKGVFKITKGFDIVELFENFSGRGYIFQETVEQHPSLTAIYPKSLNTIRVTTCTAYDGLVRVACARVRFGQGGIVVDNGSSGGFYAGVDLETGCLKTNGIRTLRFGGDSYENHPDTGVRLLGHKLPFFHEALQLVKSAANYLPNPLVGWDVAIDPKAPILIEGNEGPDYFDDEIASGPYMRNPVLQPFIEELTGRKGL